MTKPNAPRVHGPVAVDACDVGLLLSWNWSRHAAGYLSFSSWVEGESSVTLLHRIIAGATEGQLVDHVSGDTLDNRRCNLRLCTASQNMQNRRKSLTKNGEPTTSRYKGVYFSAHKQRWIAQITLAGKQRTIGRFRDESSAAEAYDAAAREVFGVFALANGIGT